MPRLYREDADLYEVAFDWDVTEEVDWLIDRLRPDCRSVLEPGCGSGRLVEALARRGLGVVGLDLSPAMVAAAERRIEGRDLDAEIRLADMTDFELGRRFHGAVCPINTLGHLRPSGLARHLACMGRHLTPGSVYLTQLPHYGPAGGEVGRTSEWWEQGDGGVRVHVTWSTEAFDLDRMLERQRSRIEIVAGPRAGEVVEEEHLMTFWTPDAWAAVVQVSPFAWTATYDGDRDDRPRVDRGSLGTLLWHELRRGSTPH